MDYLADIFLGAAALGAAFYCVVLSRRLSKFNDLEKGVGGAVAVLAVQVDDLTKTIEKAQSNASEAAQELGSLTKRAEDVSSKIQLQLASMHDLPAMAQPQPAAPKPQESTVFVRHRENA